MDVIRKPAFETPRNHSCVFRDFTRGRQKKMDWQCKVSLQFLCIDNPIAGPLPPFPTPVYQDRAVRAVSMAGFFLVFKDRHPLAMILGRRDEKISVQRSPARIKCRLGDRTLFSYRTSFGELFFPNEHCIRREETSD